MSVRAKLSDSTNTLESQSPMVRAYNNGVGVFKKNLSLMNVDGKR